MLTELQRRLDSCWNIQVQRLPKELEMEVSFPAPPEKGGRELLWEGLMGF